jgi:hypothetical protein
MEDLLDAVSIDDIAKVNAILGALESNAHAPTTENNDESDGVAFSTFKAEDLQDAFVQAAFFGSLKSLGALSKFGKNNIDNIFCYDNYYILKVVRTR